MQFAVVTGIVANPVSDIPGYLTRTVVPRRQDDIHVP
jgi:hypothetical protein